MNPIERLKALTDQMDLELDGIPPFATEENRVSEKPGCFTQKQRDNIFIHPAQLPNGQKIKLLKTQLSSVCERDCFYCPFRAGRDFSAPRSNPKNSRTSS